ncbi:MAG: glycoside hydrolase [Acidobacteriota bacterium]
MARDSGKKSFCPWVCLLLSFLVVFTGCRDENGSLFLAGAKEKPSQPAQSDFRREGGWLVRQTPKGRVLLDPRTLEVRCSLDPGRNELTLSEPVLSAGNVEIHQDTILYPDLGLSVRLESDESFLKLIFDAEIPQELPWPRVRSSAADHLILPHHEGHYVPVADQEWRSYLTRAPWNTTEHLSLPFWGWQTAGQVIMYHFENPFHNRLQFVAEGDSLTLEFTHTFPANRDAAQPQVFHIYLDSAENPIAPALRFRRWLERSGGVVTLEQKMRTAPPIRNLVGAPHAYVWDADLISRHDFLPGGMREAAKILLEATTRGISERAVWWETLDEEHRRVVRDVAKGSAPGLYAQRVVAEVVSDLVERNPEYVRSALGRFLLPSEQWGDGISRKFIDQLADLGVSRFLLVAEDREVPEKRPDIANYARERGFLFGIYDSFHSIHDPRDAGTDRSWPTAQFPPELFPEGAIIGPDGEPLRGFRGIGFKLSPRAARPYVEARVRRNFARVPYSYYFVDADAYGEFYDDYKPGREATQREDALARIARIRWIFETFRVPVGSEGGFYQFAPVLTVAEGIFLPVMGWGDPDMRDPNSRYFVGRYYPPDEPQVFFRPAELKPEYVRLHVDPRYRLPLYEAAFHDSVITSSHWSAPNLKFTNVTETVALTQLLYQVPPLYHLNLRSLQETGELIRQSFRDFAETHAYSYRYPLEEFAFLTADRLVQRARFGDLQLVANFSTRDFASTDWSVPAHSVAWRLGDRRGLSRFSPPGSRP